MAKLALSDHQVRALSVQGLTTPESVKKVVAGEPTRELTRLRVERAARELGIDLPGHEEE